MEIYKDYPYFTIGWDNEAKVAIAIWKGGFVRAVNLKAGMEEFLVFFISKKAHKGIVDARDLGVMSKDSQKWINEDWQPRYVAAGVKYMASIIPNEVLTKMSMDAVMSTLKEAVTVRYFDDFDIGLKWLKEQK